MTTLGRVDARGIQEKIDKTLVSSAAFNGEFYTYVVTVNNLGVATGTFTLVSGATASTCPTGRVLHLTGRRLYPNVNPMTVFVGGAPLQAPKFLVSVYDPISFLRGFVDPTSTSFTKFDQNVPSFFDDGRSGAGVEWSGGGQGVDIRTTDAGVSTTLGNTATFAAGNASVGQIVINGAGYITVTSTAVTATSKIFVTSLTASVVASITNVVAGSFRVNLNNAGSANFLVIN